MSAAPQRAVPQKRQRTPVAIANRRAEHRRRVIRRRRRTAVAVALLVLVLPVTYSYVSTVTKPSSLPLGIRSVEWARQHGLAWLVNGAERQWYSWNAPKKGGPALKTLPTVGNGAAAAQGLHPPRIRLAISPRLPGEGVWAPAGVGGARVLVATFRPDPVYPRIVAYVAWLDHRRTQLALYPGRYEPPSAPVRAMQVPYGQRWRLLAAFNSGFTHRDSRGGFAVNGVTYEPFRTGDATVLARRDGTVDVTTWTGGASVGPDIVLARQNLPLIVAGGRPTPNLSDGPAWGATLGNAIRVWRSGVGVDRKGNLIYAAAPTQTVSSLAGILIRAGAVRAMQLDINSEWPTFNVYGGSGGRNPTKIVPNSMQNPSRYLVPDDRDFFAVYRRTSAQSAVPFR